MKKLFSFLMAICLLWMAQSAGARAEEYEMISVEPITQWNVIADHAQIQKYEGEMTTQGQTDTYQLVVPENGRVRLEMSELYNYAKVDLRVYNRLGERIAEERAAGNGDGITLRNMNAGDVYEIRVTQRDKLSKYVLSIGMPKAELNISEITRLVDYIEYRDQRNTYMLTVKQDGRVRLEVCEMMAGMRVEMRVYDRLNQEVKSERGMGNGDGMTLTNLKAGETYTITVSYHSNLGEYTLLIGQQKEAVQCSTEVVVADSIEYTDQRNDYMVTVREDGNLALTLQEMMAGQRVTIRVFNRLMEKVREEKAISNGSVSLKGVKAGEVYMVCVYYHAGFGSYQLRID